jgi:hypothetical protein
MSEKCVLILERSSQNLQKVSEKGKTMLEGVFAEFGVENRNGRIYEEKEYLPHLEYLKKDIANGALLGELDHPERFEVALTNVSHRITELWYDQNARQIKGRIEILDGTPRGQVAKALLEANVPLSISSRAAGTVNDDKTVQIQQIYTYDLVAKPGFESAQLHNVNEQTQSRIMNLVSKLNESYKTYEKENIASKLGIINENVSIIDLNGKDIAKIRKEARQINVKNKSGESKMENNQNLSEDHVQQWTLFFKNELSKQDDRLKAIENAILEGNGGPDSGKQVGVIKKYIDEIRKIQEDSLNWQSEIAKGLNKVARHSHMVAEKGNKHYDLTKKLVETVDHNAKTLNATQDWTTRIAETVNATAEAVDFNAEMQNGMNEWLTEVSKAVNMLNEWGEEKAQAINKLHEWGTEKAKAINEMHEWTSSIAKNLNRTVNYTEDMLGRALSKEDAKKLVEYVEMVSENKADPKLKEAINEMLKINSITSKPLTENVKGLETLDDLNPKTKAHKVSPTGNNKSKTSVGVDPKTKAIIAKIKNVKLKKEGLPKGLNAKLSADNDSASKVTNSLKPNQKGLLILDLTKVIPTAKAADKGVNSQKKQNLKLDVKPEGNQNKLKEELNRTGEISSRANKLEDKLAKLISTLEKEKSIDEQLKQDYPFTSLLNENDRKRFSSLSEAEKTKVSSEVSKVPTVESEVILKLWENAVANVSNEQPLWLTAAPKMYKALYDKSSEVVKESLKAKSEFFNLSTQYQINNFWETSGLVEKITPLNESVVAKPTSDVETEELDEVVAQVGAQMKRYQF